MTNLETVMARATFLFDAELDEMRRKHVDGLVAAGFDDDTVAEAHAAYAVQLAADRERLLPGLKLHVEQYLAGVDMPSATHTCERADH